MSPRRAVRAGAVAVALLVASGCAGDDADGGAATTGGTAPPDTTELSGELAVFCEALEEADDLSLQLTGDADPEEFEEGLREVVASYEEARSVAPPEVAEQLDVLADLVARYASIAEQNGWDVRATEDDPAYAELLRTEGVEDADLELDAFVARTCR